MSAPVSNNLQSSVIPAATHRSLCGPLRAFVRVSGVSSVFMLVALRTLAKMWSIEASESVAAGEDVGVVTAEKATALRSRRRS